MATKAIKAEGLGIGHVIETDDGEAFTVSRVYHPFNLPNMIAAELVGDARVLQVPSWHIVRVLDNHDNIS